MISHCINIEMKCNEVYKKKNIVYYNGKLLSIKIVIINITFVNKTYY